MQKATAPRRRELPRPFHLDRLISTYNRATNPRALRTDREHRSNRRIARIALAMLRRDFVEGYDFRESDFSGDLINLHPF